MKILIIGFTKIKFMPYMNFYLENIDVKGNEVHLLYWNRDLQPESTEQYDDLVLHEFQCYQEDDVSKFSKINSFRQYRKYALQVIKQEKFDFIFVLCSLPGVLIADVLKKKYKDKYIFDYRDSTYEGFAPFKKIVGELVRNSAATFVSSDAFRRFLPEECNGKIHTSHNLLTDSLSHRDEKEKHGIPSDKIRIAFWGFFRNEEINKELIKKLSCDTRFELHYYGREQQTAFNLKAYAKETGADNVFFHGEYTPEERYDFVRRTDIIHNLFEDRNMMIAMGNKYYDSVIFRIPLINMRGSFMDDQATKAGIGYACNPYDMDFSEKLFDYYQGLNREEFDRNCDKELDRVYKEYTDGIEIIKSCIAKRSIDE